MSGAAESFLRPTRKGEIMNIPEQFLKNQTFDSRAIGFNRQLIPSMINGGTHGDTNIGYKVMPDGKVWVSLYGPAAKEVTAGPPENLVKLTLQEDGMWTGTIQYEDPGLKQLIFYVDGVRVVNPLAPIGYGWGYGINYIEVPDPDQDYLLIRDVPHGTVSQDYFFSAVTGETECCYVYTPPKYRDDPDTVYPVLYLQHGGGENEACWTHLGKVNFIMDNLLAEGKAVPFIIVMNNAMMQVNTDGSPRLDTSLFNDMLIRDCIPFIESKYRAIPDKKARAVAGLSMGARQSCAISRAHPGTFSYIGMFSGAVLADTPEAEAALARQMAPKVAPTLYWIGVGSADGVKANAVKLRDYCKAKGYPVEYYESDGGHTWRNWRVYLTLFAHNIFQ